MQIEWRGCKYESGAGPPHPREVLTLTRARVLEIMKAKANLCSPDSNQGQQNPGDFGRITRTSNNPRLIQFALKFNF